MSHVDEGGTTNIQQHCSSSIKLIFHGDSDVHLDEPAFQLRDPKLVFYWVLFLQTPAPTLLKKF